MLGRFQWWGNLVMKFMGKLKVRKQVLRIWNKYVFRDVNLHLEQASYKMHHIREKITVTKFKEASFHDEVQAKVNLNVFLRQKEHLVRDRSRMK